MWANSTRMGCGASQINGCAKALLVCLYEPQGNIKEHSLMTDENFAALHASGDNVQTCKRLIETFKSTN